MTLTQQQVQRIKLRKQLAVARKTLRHNQGSLLFLTDIVDVVGKHNQSFLTCDVRYSLKKAKDMADLANQLLTLSQTSTPQHSAPTAMAPNFQLPPEERAPPVASISKQAESASEESTDNSPAKLIPVFNSTTDEVASAQAYLIAAANYSVKDHKVGIGPSVFYHDRRDDKQIAFRTLFNIEVASHSRFDVNLAPNVTGKMIEQTNVHDYPVPTTTTAKTAKTAKTPTALPVQATSPGSTSRPTLSDPLNFISGSNPHAIIPKKRPVRNPYAKADTPSTKTCFQDYITKAAKKSSPSLPNKCCAFSHTGNTTKKSEEHRDGPYSTSHTWSIKKQAIQVIKGRTTKIVNDLDLRLEKACIDLNIPNGIKPDYPAATPRPAKMPRIQDSFQNASESAAQSNENADTLNEDKNYSMWDDMWEQWEEYRDSQGI